MCPRPKPSKISLVKVLLAGLRISSRPLDNMQAIAKNEDSVLQARENAEI